MDPNLHLNFYAICIFFIVRSDMQLALMGHVCLIHFQV